MSLQLAANHLAAHGRGPDTTLVHMTRGEVKGLNDLAMAHGGSLSINPQTGLPEAGFLSSILPMVGGAALTAFSGGAINPMMASLIMGGIAGVKSGSLSKGLMAGLGAYGGAGLMGGLMGAGTGELASSAISQQMPQFTGDTAAYANQVNALRSAELAKAAEVPFMEKAKAGFSNIGEAPGQFFKDNLKYAAAAAPSLIQAITPTTKQPEIKTDSDPGQRYTYSPGRVEQTPNPDPYGREQTYFQPKFSPITPATAKGIYGYADGGPVEMMSNQNAIGANTGYPMADISKGAYATPYQTPISRNVISDASDTGVNPMTGEMMFADGGVVPSTTGQGGKFEYDPLNFMFKQIESMPSDSDEKQGQPVQMGGGYNANQTNQTPGTTALPTSMVEGGGKITPMAYPSLALSKLGDAAQMGLGYLAFKMSKPNPNPNAVQVSDAGDMSSPSALADTQAQAEANNAQQAQAISAVLAGLQGTGGDGGMSAGFGAPGATSGNAGAMGFGPAGMSAGVGTGSGGGGGGGGGGGVSTGSGSGGGAAAMGTGAHGMAAGVGGAARGGLMAAYANGGSHLGDYSDGGRLLRGPGDGVSDSIPAMIGKKQPARLADGEFVVPARIVSELGNGSTEAGARKLYAMMDRIQKARGNTVGKGRVAKNSRSEKYLPA